MENERGDERMCKTWITLNIVLTCKLAISDRPARFHTMDAGGLASASQRKTNESLPSSRSICGAPSNRTVGGSIRIAKMIKENVQNKHRSQNG